MKKQILDYWHNQYILSGKGHFPEFLKLLAQGGDQATQFITKNTGLIETVGGDAKALSEAIEADQEVVENKAWFFSQAMKKLTDVRTVLNRRFAPTVVFAQSLGVATEGWSAETIVPCINTIDTNPDAGAGDDDYLILDHFPKIDIIKALQSVGVKINGNAGKAAVTAAIDTLTDEANAEFQKALGIEEPEAAEVSKQTETPTGDTLTDEANADADTTPDAGAGDGDEQ